MRKLLTISIVMLAVCTQATAQEPADLIAIRKAYAAAMDDHDLDTMFSYWIDDCVYDYVQAPPPAEGKEAIRAGFDEYIFGLYPDFHTDEGRVLAAGNIVVVEHNTIGTYLDTGIEVIGPHLDIYEFEGDKIKKATTYADSASDMIQLGMMPAPEVPELIPSITVPDPEPTGLSPMEANTEAVARWNSHDAASVAKTYHADAQIFAGPLGMALDRIATTAMNEMYYSAFPDVELEIVRAIDLGEGWVVTEFVARATHQASFMGVPAAGYPTELRLVWLTHYDADGLVTELSFYYDNMTLITQMTTAPWPLDGIWVSAVQTPLGNLILTTTYVAQDAAKTRYSGSVDEINPMPLLGEIYPDADAPAKWAGAQAELVGLNKYEATFLGYETKTSETETGKLTEFVGLFTVKAYFELLDPNTLQGHGTGSYYMAAQDADRDGFPDEGQEPAACIPWTWTGKRLTAMPGCIPAPMPEPGE